MSFMKDFEYLRIQMKDIVSATNNFHPTNMIGGGGFGKVYKGELPSPKGKVLAAFKRLDRRLGQGNIEFWKEIMILSQYKHENLISLMHFCMEGDQMILVYEYASRGSLDRYLNDVNTLPWIQRLKICVGVACGVQFLHDPKGAHQRILHRDIKSANILLDENWTAKVSDFGLSKFGPANQAHTYLVSHGVGTPGYCDPLYMELGFLTKESDVYSFGVVLFEVLCGRLCFEYHNREFRFMMPKWKQCYDEKRLDEIILPGLKQQMDPGSLKSFSAVAFQCVKKRREERPTMAKIIKELELSLIQQEIFENPRESNHGERNFKARSHDRANDDYSKIQDVVVNDGDETDDSKERKGSWFMRWLRKPFTDGSNNRKVVGSTHSHSPPQFNGDKRIALRAPVRPLDNRSRTDKEKEELDRAIALSVAEGLKKPNGHGWLRPKEEFLTKAVQPQMHISSYHPTPHVSRVCGGCNRNIGYGNYLGCMGAFFHPECFRCRACGYPIKEQEFSLSGKDAYHKTCFEEVTHPKCEVCFQFIPTNGEYRCHPFWSQKYCRVHEHDNTTSCCSCERLESVNARYISLGDGRSLCLECMESAIMDTGDCQSLYHSIRDYYEGMNMRLDQQIPMLLVERQALNEAIVGEKHGFHHKPDTRGLCLSEEQTVASVLKRPRIGGHGLIEMRTQPRKLTRRCEVTAILVLYGLPRLLTGAILAHELMHAWLRLEGYRNLNPEVEEGVCQVLSYMWLESEIIPGSSSTSASSSKKGIRSRVENKLGEFYMHQIAHDASPAFGGGFRAANAAVSMYGLRRTLNHIRLTGSFPL